MNIRYPIYEGVYRILTIGRTENNRPLPGAIKGHRVQSRQAETPERVFPRDLCITY